MTEAKKPNVMSALHRAVKTKQVAELRDKIMSVADEVFDRYVQGEGFQAIADSLPFAVPAWKLRLTLFEDDKTRDRYANLGAERAHFLVDQAVEYGRQAAQIGDAAGYNAAIGVNLKVAAKLNALAYGDKSKVELSGEGGGPIKIANLSDDQLLKIAAQAAEGAE